MFNKITDGFMIQRFDENGQFLGQNFIAADDHSWQDEFADEIEENDLPEAVQGAEHSLSPDVPEVHIFNGEDGLLVYTKGQVHIETIESDGTRRG